MKDIEKVTMAILNNLQETNFCKFFGQSEIMMELNYICRRELLCSRPLLFRIKYNTLLPVVIQTLSKQINIFTIPPNVISSGGCKLLDYKRFEVFTAVNFQIVFWVVILCSPVYGY
jgi:hypothetical protein